MHTSGDRSGWLQTVASKIIDGGATPPSIDRLNLIVPPEVITRINDGHVTAAAALGEEARKDYQAGWRIIIQEMVTLLREQGFVGGSDLGLTWMKPVDGTWKVQMPDEDNRYLTVFGQREIRMARDRMMIGERSDADSTGFTRVGVPSLFEGGRIHPLELQVLSSRGNITTQKFELHPLALALPPLTESERETLRASIARDGVKVPIVIYQKKILDGRNRAYQASVLKTPLRIVEFEGTEEEARRHVAILNLHRRHLTSAQRYLIADKLFGEQADKEAAIAMRDAAIRGNKSRSPAPLKIAEPGRSNGGGEAHERAANLATEAGISGIKPAGMRLIKELRGAPQTKAKVDSGEIQGVAKAVAEAREEKGGPKPTNRRAPGVHVHVRSAIKHLGEIRYHFQSMLNDREMTFDKVDEIRERSREIRRLHDEFDKCFGG